MAFLAKIMSFIMLTPALFGFYSNDAKDTEEAYLAAVESIAYENTIETAIPQTEIYDMIMEHYNSPLPEGKTEKKAIVIGYDGCRADALTLINNEYSGISAVLADGGSLNRCQLS